MVIYYQGGDRVKISINIDPDLTDTEIIINCGSLTAETENIIAALRMADNQLTVLMNGETHMLKIHLSDGTDIQIPHNENASEKIAELLQNGRAEAIHTTEPNLETVFMELTGKELAV